METPTRTKTVEERRNVVILFAGDSGDGIQLTGAQFTDTNALFGNDVSTFPNFPAEIRAPIGTMAGVSGYQLHFGSVELFTAGDQCDVLVVMNAAALRANISKLKLGGTVIANSDGFDARNLRLAGYIDQQDPLTDGTLTNYTVHAVDVTKMTRNALEGMTLGMKEKDRCKNMFVLGFVNWMFSRSLANSEKFLEGKFGRKPDLLEANKKALLAGYNYGDTSETFTTRFEVKPAPMPKGNYRSITGNQGTALGLIAGAQKAGLDMFYGSYPITPASDILHELAKHKNFGVKTFQAEDEIAAICSAIGASYGGALGVTASSGPGIALKGEAMGLAFMLEIPLVIVNVQRGGPSTGLPTKTEQADLFQAVHGRNGEAPIPVLAASSPTDCFEMAFEAVRIAVEHMTPVILLTDGYIANGAEPWRFPEAKDLKPITPPFATPKVSGDLEKFLPYKRDEKGVRPWAIPGMAGLQHRIGGIEKEDGTGNISYEPLNHEKMVRLRADKVRKVVEGVPPLDLSNGVDSGDLLILGWGSTYGAIKTAVNEMCAEGHCVGHLHLRYLFPFRKELGEIISRYKRVLIPEMNSGQMRQLIRAEFLVDARGLNKIQGMPFTAAEIKVAATEFPEAMTTATEVLNGSIPPAKLDYASDQEVRWCPGCGDYSILKQVETILKEQGKPKEEIVFISGIGCSSRFPYYLDTYGMHSIHGRAPAIVSGLRAVRPELSVWMITGDGDSLSIGGNHLIHLLRRNVDVNVLLFNNEIYGLTKGQYSPTSPEGAVTKSTPMGSVDHPFNPLALCKGADATFIARAMDRDPKQLREVLTKADAHRGTSLIEIYQNCNVFNDGAFEVFTEKATKPFHTLFVEHGKPLVFANGTKGIKLDGMTPLIVDLAAGEASLEDLWIHDERDSFKASILVRLFDDQGHEGAMPRPFGVFYITERSTVESRINAQVEQSKQKRGVGDLDALLRGERTWTIG